MSRRKSDDFRYHYARPVSISPTNAATTVKK